MMRRSVVAALTLSMLACSQLQSRGSVAQNEAAAPADEDAPLVAVPVKGQILERIDAAPYSYLRLRTGAGEVWAAVPQTSASVGTEVTMAQAFPMADFESRALGRKFDVVYFGTLDEGRSAAPVIAAHAGAGSLPAGHPPIPSGAGRAEEDAVAATAPSPPTDAKVAKATGPDARTVAEVHAQRSELNDKTVAVHGRVVKLNAGIMGRNWIHLRDGSGSQAKGDDDLTVTSHDTVAVGDVITARGTVRTDKDFGAGYVYSVIIEDAKISK